MILKHGDFKIPDHQIIYMPLEHHLSTQTHYNNHKPEESMGDSIG